MRLRERLRARMRAMRALLRLERAVRGTAKAQVSRMEPRTGIKGGAGGPERIAEPLKRVQGNGSKERNDVGWRADETSWSQTWPCATKVAHFTARTVVGTNGDPGLGNAGARLRHANLQRTCQALEWRSNGEDAKGRGQPLTDRTIANGSTATLRTTTRRFPSTLPRRITKRCAE